MDLSVRSTNCDFLALDVLELHKFQFLLGALLGKKSPILADYGLGASLPAPLPTSEHLCFFPNMISKRTASGRRHFQE